MRKIFLLTLIIAFPLFLISQNISVKSFRQLTNDMDARVTYPKTDQNGDKCAIIKVQTTETGFGWDGDMMGIIAAEKKMAEYWLYIPHGAKRLTIKHEKLGILRDYLYTEPIQEATVYEMVLTTGKVVTTVENIQAITQWVVITSEPTGADVFINDMNKGTTPFQMEMDEGSYTYRISKDLYHPEVGVFDLKGKKFELKALLKVNFGFISIISSPETGMNVSIDGTPIGKITPCTTDRLKSGKHKVTISKPLFYDFTQEIEVLDGQTLPLTLDSKPAFGAISIDSKPEAGATVLLDGKETGLITPCKLDKIASGDHTITLRKEWYEPQGKKVLVVDGKTEKTSFDLQPTFGNVTVQTCPDCEVFIDEKSQGKGKWEGRLIAGYHTFETRKDKYHPANQKVQIQLGQPNEISLDPQPMEGTLKIVTQPMGANITMNGIDQGTTPNTIKKLLIGDYRVVLKMDGFANIEKTVKITENQTIEVNETLMSSTQISISSKPSGATISLNSNNCGSTPLKINAPFGKSSLVLSKSGYIQLNEIINVTEANKSFSFTLISDQAHLYKKQLKQNQAYKFTWTILAAGTLGASGYFYFNAQKNYTSYQSATGTDAGVLHSKVTTSTRNAIICGSAAVITGVAALVCKKKGKQFKAKLDMAVYMLPQGNKGVWLAYKF